MNDKQILDRLESINLSLRQKQDLIDVIKDIIANSEGGGGGTSTDKDTLTIVFDYNTKTVTVNNKQFLISSSSEGITEINNKELYNILYNYVVNTNMPVFIKAIDNSFQVSGYATCLFDGENIVQLLLYVIDGTCIIVVYNK